MSKLDQLRSFLSSQGYRPQVTDDYLAFKHEGGNYVLPAHHDDPTFFQIIFPNFWKIESDQDRARVLEVSAGINMMVKSVKVFPHGNETSAVIDLRLAKADDFAEVFRLALQTLQTACREFAAAMHRANAGAMDMLRQMIDRLRDDSEGRDAK